MKPPNEHEAIERALDALAALLGADDGEARLLRPYEELQIDVLAEIGAHTLAIEWKNSGAVAPVGKAVALLRRYLYEERSEATPVVAVPYMGEAGKRLCAEANVSWLDLSGNATISGPGLRILVEGRPNAFARRGRPSNVFAPKSSRIARWLLMSPDSSVSQRELSRAVGVDEGLVSRVVKKLLDDALIARNEQGGVYVPDPDLLLEAWNEAYDFSKHEFIRGHVAARSGDSLTRMLAEALDAQDIEHAATGLAAAWVYTHFAGFRTASFYVRSRPSRAALDKLGFREDERGANVWLVIPRDEGVFHGAEHREGVHCVHAVQAWLDLHAHPERATEAAERLRKEHLTWRSDV